MHWVYRRRKGQIRSDPRDTHHSSDRHRWHRQKRRKTQNNPQIRYSLTRISGGILANRAADTTSSQIRPKTNALAGMGVANRASPDRPPRRSDRGDPPPCGGAKRSNRQENAPTKRPVATSRRSAHAVRAGAGRNKAADGPAPSGPKRPQNHPSPPDLTPPSTPALLPKRGSPNSPAGAPFRPTSGRSRFGKTT